MARVVARVVAREEGLEPGPFIFVAGWGRDEVGREVDEDVRGLVDLCGVTGDVMVISRQKTAGERGGGNRSRSGRPAR